MPEPADLLTLNRREAILRVTALLGGVALVGGNALLTGCRSLRTPGVGATMPFSEADVAFLDEVAETILPETKTPGAKAAKVGAFMAVMVTDCYDERDQRIFRLGMQQLDEAGFTWVSPQARLRRLEALDREQKIYMDSKAADAPAHYFRMMKELALLGYFTSEIGYTQAQRYVESPGRFDPCLPHKAGETSWAPHA
jgi:hypothetical protein